MAQHILRKDLKKDEIREKLVSGVESVASHQQALWLVVTAALVVALAVFGWNTLRAAADGQGLGGARRCDENFPGAHSRRRRTGRPG